MRIILRFSSVTIAILVAFFAVSAEGWWFSSFFKFNGSKCKTVTPVTNVDLKTYASKPWYAMSQMQTQSGNPNGQWNYCVKAQYTIKDPNNVAVYNFANEGGVNKIPHEANLCATVADPNGQPGKLAVGPCWLPNFFYGPYWIVAYNEQEGYALISGGHPTNPTKNGLCATGTGVNNSGLWIFTRSNVRDEALIAKVKQIARNLGYDTDVLQEVIHQGCLYKAT